MSDSQTANDLAGRYAALSELETALLNVKTYKEIVVATLEEERTDEQILWLLASAGLEIEMRKAFENLKSKEADEFPRHLSVLVSFIPGEYFISGK